MDAARTAGTDDPRSSAELPDGGAANIGDATPRAASLSGSKRWLFRFVMSNDQRAPPKCSNNVSVSDCVLVTFEII